MVETKTSEAKVFNISVKQSINFNGLFGEIKRKSARIWGKMPKPTKWTEILIQAPLLVGYGEIPLVWRAASAATLTLC